MRRLIFSIILLAILWGGYNTRSLAFADEGGITGLMTYIHTTLEEKADDIDLLARVIEFECGADWCSDELQYLTGAVVINRVYDSRFPNTIRDVIFAPGQYATAGMLYTRNPSERSVKVAQKIILWGVEDTPPDMVFQANFIQGREVYKKLEGVYLCCG